MTDSRDIDTAPQRRTIRAVRVLLDSDLSALYGVPTKRSDEQSRLRSQFATSNTGRGGRRYSATAFTEHGAIMAVTILNSPLAVEMSLHVVRAFVKLRHVLASSAELARRLKWLEKSVTAFDASTRKEFVRVYKTILDLMGPASREQ